MSIGTDVEEHVSAAGPDLYVLRSGRHTGQFENLLEILADIEHCTKNPFEVVTPALAEELHSLPFKAGAQRVVTSITLDDRRDIERGLGDKQLSVNKRLKEEKSV